MSPYVYICYATVSVHDVPFTYAESPYGVSACVVRRLTVSVAILENCPRLRCTERRQSGSAEHLRSTTSCEMSRFVSLLAYSTRACTARSVSYDTPLLRSHATSITIIIVRTLCSQNKQLTHTRKIKMLSILYISLVL